MEEVIGKEMPQHGRDYELPEQRRIKGDSPVSQGKAFDKRLGENGRVCPLEKGTGMKKGAPGNFPKG